MTTFAVIDTETTGIEETDQVLEIAIVKLDGQGQIVDQWHSLVRPSVPVSPLARAAHHIRDDELEYAPTLGEIWTLIVSKLPYPGIIAGHFLDFDLKMLDQSGLATGALPAQRICTWTCARHLWPDAPSHKNQVLRYWLDLQVPFLNLPPHRALPDALVTATLLQRMLQECDAERLLHLTQTMPLQKTVPMGMHRGTVWADVPFDYLEWILRCDNPPFSDDIRHTARYWRDWRRRRWVRRRVRQYRERRDADEHKPDRGSGEEALRVREGALSGVPPQDGGSASAVD